MIVRHILEYTAPGANADMLYYDPHYTVPAKVDLFYCDRMSRQMPSKGPTPNCIIED